LGDFLGDFFSSAQSEKSQFVGGVFSRHTKNDNKRVGNSFLEEEEENVVSLCCTTDLLLRERLQLNFGA
jgi:hypothetical protein